MSNLITCSSLAKSFGPQKLFSSISFTVHSGERIGIVGPNGSGKSTLLKIICGLEEMDSGEVRNAKFCRLSYLAQQDFLNDNASIVDNLYCTISNSESQENEYYTQIHSLLSRAEFPDISLPAGTLSGGWRKRLAICKAMVGAPDVLVLDEPTNHLDIEGILWLEKMLESLARDSAFLVVSHDRRFLENCTNRIIEISAVYPEGCLQVNGNYSTFLEKRQEFLDEQQQNEGRLRNTLRQELEWLRRAPKARATKAKYRSNQAHKLLENLAEVKKRNQADSNVQIDFSATGRKTKILLETKGISKSFVEKTLFSKLDIVLSPGSRIGLLGRNGSGKSTLMQILKNGENSGEITSDSGTIRTASKVKIVHFDQRRTGLNPQTTLRRALAPDGDAIIFRERSLHVVSWAKKFLFSPAQLDTPVGQLSGGEQARIFIAELMRQPADILLLDEPGNDLDISSLNVLEESLLDFPGALVIVSHDRFLLDRICDKVLGFDGKGHAQFFADYEQWLEDIKKQKDLRDDTIQPSRKIAKKKSNTLNATLPKRQKLSYLEQREYDQLEEKISTAEEIVNTLTKKVNDEEIAADAEALAACWAELEKAKVNVEELYARWEELEKKKI